MAKNVFLDALIFREDFEVSDDSKGSSTLNVQTIGIRDLEKGSFFYSSLRKPDFQRETNEWDSERVVSLIKSFLEGDLIPAVILWKSRASYTFVIDGAHRLSALSAWINNDFGDGEISKKFYDGIIPDEQIEIAEKTRNLVRKKIGLFSDYKLAIESPEKVSDQVKSKSKMLGTLAIQVQWVEGDEQKAEASFFKINQKAAAIDKTELELLKTRRKPNGIATRAILRSGKGHKYWSAYNKERQENIQKLAEEIHEIIFTPKLKNPVKTLDLPIGGKSFTSQSQPLVLSLVNKVNGISDFKDEKERDINDDSDGSITESYLLKTLKILRRINSNHASSLGLHPAIYFYAKDGRHKPVSFGAIVELILELELKNKFSWFIDVREKFEEFLLEYDYLTQQIGRKYRSGNIAHPHIKNFYMVVLDKLHDDQDILSVLKAIMSKNAFNYLTLSDEHNESVSKDFSSTKKSAIFLTEALKNSIKCKICGGYLHVNSISFDHIVRRQDGGLGSLDNAQLTHPYCNTTYKN